jgi:hypothetical protein
MLDNEVLKYEVVCFVLVVQPAGTIALFGRERPVSSSTCEIIAIPAPFIPEK